MVIKPWFMLTIFKAGLVLGAAPQIKIDAGTIHGTVCENIDTSVYRSIPFAQPPVGNLRFMPPQPLNTSFPNAGLNATQFSAACIQIPGEFAYTQPSTSEDCLTLTVYVPSGSKSNLPVKVFAHGGANTDGSASYPLYDLCHLATDSIAVAIQYRLGPLGFLALESAGIEGNMGIKDQLAALEWVQTNIAAFGGDSKKVLLFGQSSGADDVFAIASLTQAKSLVSSVICESGGGFDLHVNETMQNVGADYAIGLNCSSTDVICLQSRSVDQLVSVYDTLPVFNTGLGSFSNPALSGWQSGDFPNATNMALPFLDGKLFTEQPLVVGPQVPIVFGSTTKDGSLFAAPTLFEGGSITAENYSAFLAQFGPQASAVAQRYPLSSFNSSGSTQTAVLDALTHIQTVFSYKCFSYRGLRSAANSGVPAYAYSFDHVLSCPWLYIDGTAFPTSGEAAFLAQPMHTAELPLVFGNLADQPWGNGTCNMSQAEYEISDTLRAAWTAMAATGNPSTSSLSWTAFNECSTPGLYIGNTTTIQQLDFSECEFWDEIQHELGGVEIAWPSAQSCEKTGSAASNSTSHTSGQPGGMHVGLGSLMVGSLLALSISL